MFGFTIDHNVLFALRLLPVAVVILGAYWLAMWEPRS